MKVKDIFKQELSTVIKPNDPVLKRLTLDELVEAYFPKYQIACELRPKIIVEIGVRAGYPGWALCKNGTVKTYMGFDAYNGTHSGEKLESKFKEWAEKIIKPLCENFSINVVDTSTLNNIPVFFDRPQLYHVDGDHSFDAARKDIYLCTTAAPSGSLILVDDVDYISSVKRAVLDVIGTAPYLYKYEHRESLRGEALLWRQ